MLARVKSWEDHQHYKDRAPPWIKLHRALLDDFGFHCLPVASRALAPMLWLLASENEGVVNCDPAFLAFRLRMDKAEAVAAVKPLIDNGWLILEQGASKALADCNQIACLETETETETEIEEERETEAEKPLSSSQKREPDRSAEVREVFDYWREVHDHARARLDDKRYRNIRARLSDGYTVDDLKTAIGGCLKSPHHQGENDRATVYDDIELICRSAKHVDQFIRFADGPDLTSMSQSARQTAIAAAEWITEGNA